MTATSCAEVWNQVCVFGQVEACGRVRCTNLLDLLRYVSVKGRKLPNVQLSYEKNERR